MSRTLRGLSVSVPCFYPNFAKGEVVDNEAITNFFACWHDKYEVQNDPAKAEKILAEAHPSVKPTLEELLRAYLASPHPF